VSAGGEALTCAAVAMSATAPTYDLVLLLDPEAEDTARTKLVSDARESIAAQGELLRHDEWGDRALSYPIHRRSAAEYHLLQFHANSPGLLRALDRTLRIADDVLRFRIIKLRPGVPEAPDMRAAPAPARRSEGETGGAPERAAGAPASGAGAPPQAASEGTEQQAPDGPPAPPSVETAPEPEAHAPDSAQT
jgi:small subunit ribosomal protein S6